MEQATLRQLDQHHSVRCLYDLIIEQDGLWVEYVIAEPPADNLPGLDKGVFRIVIEEIDHAGSFIWVCGDDGGEIASVVFVETSVQRAEFVTVAVVKDSDVFCVCLAVAGCADNGSFADALDVVEVDEAGGRFDKALALAFLLAGTGYSPQGRVMADAVFFEAQPVYDAAAVACDPITKGSQVDIVSFAGDFFDGTKQCCAFVGEVLIIFGV